MLAKMTSASFDTSTGRVSVSLDTSTSVGYPNNCQQFGDYGHIAVPLPGQLVEVTQQALAQVQVTGYNNQVKDTNFSLNPGESASYNANWYTIHSLNGEYIQEAQTAHVENVMMGQSTNAVLKDILDYLVGLESYIGSHVHSGCGGTNDSGGPTTSPPDVSAISADVTYIGDNKNLAITGTYTPNVSLADIYARLKELM